MHNHLPGDQTRSDATGFASYPALGCLLVAKTLNPLAYAAPGTRKDWSLSVSDIGTYAGVRAAGAEAFANMVPGNPAAVGAALLTIVDADNPPLRVFCGSDPLQIMPTVYTERGQHVAAVDLGPCCHAGLMKSESGSGADARSVTGAVRPHDQV